MALQRQAPHVRGGSAEVRQALYLAACAGNLLSTLDAILRVGQDYHGPAM